MNTAQTQVRPMAGADWPAVKAVYEAAIVTANATFETAAPAWEAWDTGHPARHRLVAVAGERVIGWAALSPVSERCIYAGVAEDGVNVDPGAWRQGVGHRLLAALVAGTEADGIWTVPTGIFPENRPSVRLHHGGGFRVVGTRRRIGRHHGRWRGTLLLEPRSPLIH